MELENNINKFLVRNAIISWSMVAISVACLLIAAFTIHNAVGESRKYLYMIRENGDIAPIEWIERRNNIEIEAKHHITMFVDYFYNINQYTQKTNIEKALWLGNFQNLYADRVNKNYFNNTLLDIEYMGEIEHMELYPTDNDGSYLFQIIINATTRVAGSPDKITKIFAKGNIKVTSREFPHNPHGLYIDNYVEEKIVNINE